MKKIALCILAAVICIAADAKPRGMGMRFGATGIEASYQLNATSRGFVQIDFGMDLGYNANGRPGAKAAFSYDFIWAEPAWTARGTWSIYTGPGITLGFVDDIVPYDIEGSIKGYHDYGFMIGGHLDIGLEYTFNFPVSIALNVRPCIGIHVNDGKMTVPGTDLRVEYGSKADFYQNGLVGFVPSLALRYRF